MKAYVKPDLFYESFELSQHIATCGIDVVNSTAGTNCETLDADYWGYSVSIYNDDSCGVKQSTLDSYCYTTGSDVKGRTFNS